MTVDVRRLTLSDLDAVERIEREAYPTPWSRSMFAGELAKPSSASLGALILRTTSASHTSSTTCAPASAYASSEKLAR